MSDGRESGTKNHLGYQLQRIKGVWNLYNIKTLETVTSVDGIVWEQGELVPTISGTVLFNVFLIYSICIH